MWKGKRPCLGESAFEDCQEWRKYGVMGIEESLNCLITYDGEVVP